MTTEFTLTGDHLKLLRAANVTWDPDGCGAPCVDSKRPYGNGSHLRDIAALVIDGWDGLDREQRDDVLMEEDDRLRALHAETEEALQIVLATGAFETGRYRLIDWGTWERVDDVPAVESARDEALGEVHR